MLPDWRSIIITLKQIKPISVLLIAGLFLSCGKEVPPFPPTGLKSAYPNICQTDNGFIMIWYEDNQHIVMSEFNGKNWSNKDTIISSKHFFKNWADLTQIYHIGGDTIAVSWLEMIAEGTYDYGIKIAVSVNRGHTWSNPIRPHRDSGKGEHGFLSFFLKPSGELGFIWLDGRYMGEYDSSTHTIMGDMALYTSGLSKDLTLENEKSLDDRVCECCPTSAVEVPGGVLAVYRDRSNEEIRNINLIRYSDGDWSESYPVFDDSWFVPGCPVNGPAIAANGQQVAITWYTAPDNDPKVNVVFSRDSGQSFTGPIQIDDGSVIGRTDILWLNNETVLVSWLEEGTDNGELIIKTVNIDGRLKKVASIDISSGRGSGYPKLARIENYIFITWTEPGEDGGIKSEWIHVGELVEW